MEKINGEGSEAREGLSASGSDQEAKDQGRSPQHDPPCGGDAQSGRRALILGGASCVWEDIEAALQLSEFDLVIACNDIGTAWAGELDVWVTLHPENMSGWVAQRTSRRYPPAKRIVYHEAKAGTPKPDLVTPYHWHRHHKSASSGLFSAKVAIELGVTRGVLCGVPLTMTPHFNDKGDWAAASSFHDGLVHAAPFLKDNIRSMSGRTKEVLGEPTLDWLAGG